MAMRILATILFVAQSVLPFSADACACDSHRATVQMESCCQQTDAKPCECGCFLTIEQTEATQPATITQAPRPHLDVVLADVQDDSELAVTCIAHDRHQASVTAVPGVPLPRAERAPPA